jgi:nucleoside-diphosphate-sugar epimerase
MRILVTGGSGFIGTHLVENLLADRHEVRNLDIAPPKLSHSRSCWIEGDVTDDDAVMRLVESFFPQVIYHLAARTDMEGDHVEDYAVNYEGTQQLLDAACAQPSVERFILVSTQFVHQQPNSRPQHDTDFAPHTLYGESKVRAERALHAIADPNFAWAIARPTNIWGAWHPRYPLEAWRVIRKGLYVHPGRQPVIRSYGYVKNVVYQLRGMLEAPRDVINGKVFYVGDEAIDVFDWVEGFSQRLNGRGVRVVPRAFVHILALVGDGAKTIGIRFPITRSRFHSMTTDNEVSIQATTDAFGRPPHSLADGITETVTWLREQDGDFWGIAGGGHSGHWSPIRGPLHNLSCRILQRLR